MRFDEKFVRAARFIEPSALERASPQGGGPALGAPRPGGVLPARLSRPRRVIRWLLVRVRWPGRRAARLVALAAVLLGVTGAGLLLFRQNTFRAVTPSGSGGHEPSTVRAASLTTAPPSVGGFALDTSFTTRARIGACLAWTPGRVGHPPGIRVVECAAPHVDEVTGVLDLAGSYPRWPGTRALDALAGQWCAGELSGYLAGVATRPVVAGWVYPDEPSWDGGVRDLACTARPPDLVPVTGSLHAGAASGKVYR
jgi:Septum formation